MKLLYFITEKLLEIIFGLKLRKTCLLVAKLIILFWFEQLVKIFPCQKWPLWKPYYSAVLFWSCQLGPWWWKKWFSVLLTSDISAPIFDLLFKEFSSKFVILQNNATEKNVFTKRFVWQIKNLFWAESLVFRIIWKIEGNICLSK